MPGPGHGHIGQSALIVVVSVSVFLFLRQVSPDTQEVAVIPGIVHAGVPDLTDCLVLQIGQAQTTKVIPRFGSRTGVMGESGENHGIGPDRYRNRLRILQPGICRVPVTHSHRRSLSAQRLDFQVVALLAREGAGGQSDDGHGIPFQTLGLVDGHQGHIGMPTSPLIGQIGTLDHGIHPGHESSKTGPQAGR